MSPETQPRTRVLVLSTLAFTLMFNVWLMLGVLGVPIKKAMGLSNAQVEWLLAAAILSGAIFRLNFGIWADRFGGKRVFAGLLFATAIPCYLFAFASNYPQLIACALLFGLAGNSFSAGIAWNSAWFPDVRKGTALGIFGAGNVGAAGTKLLVVLVPSVLTLVPAAGLLGGWLPGGWRAIPVFYSAMLMLFGVLILAMAPSPDRSPGRGRPMAEMLAPLRSIRVWRFSLYYVVVFGAYVALSSWLPKYYMDTYGLTLKSAALLTATFILPASLLRPFGGYLSDRLGPRVVTYSVFLVMTVALAALAIPNGTYGATSYRLEAAPFAALVFVVGCGMGIGKASVFKYIPNFFPNDVGAVGGLVGMLGALGGFVLPPLFGLIGRATGSPQSAFVALLVPTVASLAWLHAAVMAANAKERGARVTAPLQAILRASTEVAS